MLDVSDELNELSRSVIGAAIEVHRVLGPGHLEAIYERALRIELEERGLAFENQVRIPMYYRGREIGESRLDLVVAGQLVVEIKAVEQVIGVHRAQLLSYLRAGAYQLGLVINFNGPMLTQGVVRVISSG